MTKAAQSDTATYYLALTRAELYALYDLTLAATPPGEHGSTEAGVFRKVAAMIEDHVR